MNSDPTENIVRTEHQLLESLERLIPELPPHEVRRLLQEAHRDAPGDFEQQWPTWAAYVCAQSDRRCQIVSGSVELLLSFLDTGSQVIAPVERSSSGIKVASLRRSGRLISIGHTGRVKTARAQEILGSSEKSDRFRFVVVEPPTRHESARANASGTHANHHGSHAEHHESPLRLLRNLLQPEWSDLGIVLLFALVIGVLTLTTPIAVEALVDTVAFGRSFQPVIVLSAILLGFLGFNALLLGLQTYVVEIIQRRLFARLAGEIAIKLPRVIQTTQTREFLPETINRFLDVVTIQKSTASLVIGGTSIVLSTLIGMTILAFYHPWLLGFDLVLLALIGMMILVLGRGAVRTSIEESRMKYATLAWFEDVSRCPLTFRNRESLQFCVDQANTLASSYLIARENHFRIVFRQFGFALLTQALASTVLLGLGGWLVISRQLTLGQLVAAELIVTVILGSFAKLGKQLESFYDLLTAVDKVNIIRSLPVESGRGEILREESTNSNSGGMILRDVEHSRISSPAPLNDVLQHGETILIEGEPGSGKSLLLRMMFGMEAPEKGYLQYCGEDLRHLQLESLRSRMYLLADVEVFTGSIRSNLLVGADEPSGDALNSLLKELDLLHVILSLPEGLDTVLAGNGSTLSSTHLKLLMVTRCLLRDPEIVGFDGFLDTLPMRDIHRVLDLCAQRPDRIVIIASNHPEIQSRIGRKLSLDAGTSEKTGVETPPNNDASSAEN